MFNSDFRSTGLRVMRSAIRNGSTISMFLRSSGRFSSNAVTFRPGTIAGRGSSMTISGRQGRRGFSVPASAINWQSVQVAS